MREYKKDWKYNDVIPAEDVNRWEKNTEEIDDEMQTISGNLLSLAAVKLGESDTVEVGGAFNKNIENMYSVGEKISVVEENFTVNLIRNLFALKLKLLFWIQSKKFNT